MDGHTDLLIERARELLELDESWHWCRLECLPHGKESTYTQITLAQKDAKGKFQRPFHVVNISHRERAAYAGAWERTHGKCAECLGTGQEWAGWSKDAGNRYRPCGRCKGEPLKGASDE